MDRSFLKISQSVNGLSEVVQTFAPTAGVDVQIDLFMGSCPNGMNQTIQLLWKYGTGSEATIWQFTGPGDMPFTHLIAGADVNGTDRLAIKCKNASVTPANMSAYAEITEF